MCGEPVHGGHGGARVGHPAGGAGDIAGRGAAVPRSGSATTRTAARSGAVAVIPVFGVLTQHGGGWWAGTATEEVSRQLQQALADRAVAGVVLQCDSPGGDVAGVSELAAEIYAARKVKPVVASVDSLAASAAFWLASNASEVVASPSAELGGIGVYVMHADLSRQLERHGLKVSLISAGKYKTLGNQYEPLGLAVGATLQERVDAFGALFRADVARGRGRAVGSLTGPAWEGRVVSAQWAMLAGLADRVGTFQQAISRAAHLAGSAAVRQAARADDQRLRLLLSGR